METAKAMEKNVFLHPSMETTVHNLRVVTINDQRKQLIEEMTCTKSQNYNALTRVVQGPKSGRNQGLHIKKLAAVCIHMIHKI